MPKSVIDPTIEYDQENWAVSVLWERTDGGHEEKRLVIEGETATTPLIMEIECRKRLTSETPRIVLKETRFNQTASADDARNSYWLFDIISENRVNTSTHIVTKETILCDLLKPLISKLDREGRLSINEHEMLIKMAELEDGETRFNSLLTEYNIALPDTHEQFAQQDNTREAIGAIARTPSQSKFCTIT